MTTNTSVEPKSTTTDNQNEEKSSSDTLKQPPEARKISRALRFGTSHEVINNSAKKRRLERFGAVPNSLEDIQQKKRQRIDRFHVVNPISTVNEEAKKKRIDRFGVVTPSTNGKSASTISALSDVIKKRAERFGDISQVAKANTLKEQKIKRAERFKPISNV